MIVGRARERSAREHRGRVALVSVLAVALSVAGPALAAQGAAPSGTTRFVLDGNRIYAELGFVRPDHTVHRALAFVDMGSASMDLARSLFTELGIDHDHPLEFTVGTMRVKVSSWEVTSERQRPASIGADLDVEGMLSAGILQRYRVVIDYARRTLTLEQPRADAPKPAGVPVPFRINPRTGLISVDATIDSHRYAIAIDNGSAYSWIRGDSAHAWLASHPEWVRGVGAVGASNMTMTGDATETSGTMMRIPAIALGALALRNVGALAAGHGPEVSGSLDLFGWYSSKNAGPVIGWIGGNILEHYRLTIDYPNRTMYWEQESQLDVRDLDQVGLTLRADDGAITVAAIAARNGRSTVDGVMPGDTLVRIGKLDVATASHGAIYDALHGRPGELRALTLGRNGTRVTVNAKVTGF